MAYTRDQLKTRALHDDFDPAKYGNQVVEWLNEALHRVARRVSLPPLEKAQTVVTADGDALYDLATNLVRVEAVHIADPAGGRVPLDEVTNETIDEAAIGSGKPTAYALYAGQLYLYPTPDGAYSVIVVYFESPSFAAADTTTAQVGFPDDYADVLVDYARSKLFDREDDPETAAKKMADFDRGVVEMRVDLARLATPRTRQIPGMWSGEDECSPTFVTP